MATPTTRWLLLPILVVILPGCCVSSGPPALPYDLDCIRPCDQNACSVIKCVWSPDPPPDNSTTYSLHWEPVNNDEGQRTGGSSADGSITLEQFPSHEDLRVWVQAENQHGSVKSKEVVFNTENIIKRPPPTISSDDQDTLEIQWDSPCHEQQAVGSCEVRYRTKDQDWSEAQHKKGLHNSYGVENPEANTVFEFQVRCSCFSTLMSEWSEIYRARSPELAPVGQVDVWVDCVTLSSSSDCFLTWKNLSLSQALGFILGFEVRISYGNGTERLINVSAVNSGSLWAYDEGKWRLTTSLEDVSSVSVSAYNALGATNATHLFIPEPGQGRQGVNDRRVELQMNEGNLTVSWELRSPSTDNVMQYVVQYKEWPPSKSFDWIKVDKEQTTVSFKGALIKNTYQVSLFAVTNLNEIRQLSTATGYPTLGVPSTVPSFKVSLLGSTDVTLVWEPVPISKRNGVILYYQIGVVGTQKVYNVSVGPDHGDTTHHLTDLSQGREYQVWISAVTETGPGSNVTTTFKTKPQEDFGNLIPILVSLVPLVIITGVVTVVFCVCREPKKICSLCLYGKVPDPRNSHIFKHMKHQINEPLTWICISVYEPNPMISLLEVVEIKPEALDPDCFSRPAMGTGCSQTDSRDSRREDTVIEENDRTDRRYGREEYSKMIDSDEDRNDECSSEDEQFTSGYEKHFMPSALEILQN
ncbi:interleukin 12 receptor, beta 2a, like [Kryptolebias marmoratus]|uniref:Interleukin-12 receptor subunit beta-2-like n=1 Tax=Kryptolebias marmoratus TaxID=37003 RepID=A0A3Q3BFW6_KRYMA|nr:interleukin 12 receptor, beta 2a, like [Kryptolebias marmoratus]XP_017277264.1 interleukin 12 receptor, beta 2a, like [Kryptolebias marmoratus]